ncbi:MAG TPA: hypothetical protein VEH27_15315 [Methylomirabilota bacterium]|nr:hypothetical protein [Methylomirabilota bacterium]
MASDLVILKRPTRFEGFVVESGAMDQKQKASLFFEGRRYLWRASMSEYFDITTEQDFVQQKGSTLNN